MATRYSLADAMRDGSVDIKQEFGGWGDGVGSACALKTAWLSAKKKGYQ